MSSRRVGALSSSFTCMEPLFIYFLHMNSLERCASSRPRARLQALCGSAMRVARRPREAGWCSFNKSPRL